MKSDGQGAPGGRLNGPPPRHFGYFDEFAADEPAAAVAPRVWIARFGAGVADRVDDIGEALVFGGHTLMTTTSVWMSLKRLRIPSIVRHAYETGVQAVPVVAVIAFLIAVISAYIGAQQLRPRMARRNAGSPRSRVSIPWSMGSWPSRSRVGGPSRGSPRRSHR